MTVQLITAAQEPFLSDNQRRSPDYLRQMRIMHRPPNGTVGGTGPTESARCQLVSAPGSSLNMSVAVWSIMYRHRTLFRLGSEPCKPGPPSATAGSATKRETGCLLP
jgi:hypothetical protein